MEKYDLERRVNELKPEIMRQLHTLRTENALLKDQIAMRRAALNALVDDVFLITKRHNITGPATSASAPAPGTSTANINSN